MSLTDNRLTIVIPTLNEELFLPRLLRDLSRQADKNFEVVIVDGNSKDKTKEVAKRFERFFPLRIYNVRRRHVSYQRNYGGKRSNAPYICFIDADARLHPLFTRKVTLATKRGKLLMPTLKSEKRNIILPLLVNLTNSYIYMSNKLRTPLSAGGCLFIEKRLFLRLKGYDENVFLSEDHHLVKKAWKLGIRPIILKDVEIVISMRRVEYEGYMRFFYKMVYSYFYQLGKGKINRPIFAYEMGGDQYKY